MKKIFLMLFIAAAVVGQTKNEKTVIELKQELTDADLSHANSLMFEDKQKKSAGLAIIYSLLLPGMGELYAGDYSSGLYFTIADGVCWTALTGLNLYGSWQQDNYKSFARSNGSVNLDGKDETYFATIANYNSIDEYNEEKALNRDYDNMYDTQTFYWKWQDNDQRREYRNMWSSSEQAYNNVRFAVGALLLNRVVSAINAVRLVAKYNKSLSGEISWKVNFGVINNPTLPPQFTVNFTSRF